MDRPGRRSDWHVVRNWHGVLLTGSRASSHDWKSETGGAAARAIWQLRTLTSFYAPKTRLVEAGRRFSCIWAKKKGPSATAPGTGREGRNIRSWVSSSSEKAGERVPGMNVAAPNRGWPDKRSRSRRGSVPNRPLSAGASCDVLKPLSKRVENCVGIEH